MSQQDFDRHLKASLDHYRTELDTEALWNDLAPQLTPVKKRRRFIFWWWTGAGLLLTLACWGGFQMIVHHPDRAPSAPAKTLLRPMLATGTQDETRPLSMDQAETPKDESVQTGLAVKKRTTEKPLQMPQTDSVFFETVILSPVFPGQREDREGALSEQPDAPENTTASMNEPVSDGQAIPPGWAAIDLLPALRVHFLVDTPVSLRPPALPETAPDPGPRWRRIFRLDTGIGKTFKTLHQDSVSAYLTTRRTTERPLEYVSASLMGGYQHRFGLYFMAGLGYTRINERFDYQRSYTETEILPDGITGIYIGAGGDTTFTYGPVESTQTFFYHKRTYNSYTLIDLPLTAGFSLERDRLSLAAEGGIAVNLRLKTRGEIFDRLDGYVRLEESEYFRARVGVSYFGSIRLGYAVNCHLQLSLAPSFRIFSGSFTTEETGMSQRYTLVGVNLGARWRF